MTKRLAVLKRVTGDLYMTQYGGKTRDMHLAEIMPLSEAKMVAKEYRNDPEVPYWEVVEVKVVKMGKPHGTLLS